MQIKKATVDDMPELLDFIRQLAEYEKLAHQVRASESLLREHLFGARPAAEAIFAEADGRKVGFALFYTNFSTFLGKPGIYLEDLFVLPEARGGGLGKKLLSYLAGLVVERGYGRLDWAVLDWNTPSIEFYNRLGAKPLSDWITFRLEGDALRAVAGSRG